MAIFTICANNRVPMAKVLLDSAQTHHPDATLYLCLADTVLDEAGFYPEGCLTIPAEALGIPDFPCFAFRYDVAEFIAALKPFMMRKLLSSGHRAVLYLDPDVEIFRPLTRIMEALHAGASFVLTPRMCEPQEGADVRDDIRFIDAGVYSRGFLAVGAQEEADRLLRWWSRRVANDDAGGSFTDQTVVDLLPAFATQAVILRDASLNVTFLNLSQRHLTLDEGGRWLVEGAPLGFFHFSGFDPSDPLCLSKPGTSGGETGLAFQRLVSRYAALLLDRGYGTIPAGIYGYGRFRSGAVIPRLVRQLFRTRIPFWVGDPFETFEDYLDTPLPGSWNGAAGRFLTRLAGYVHETKPGLKQMFDPADETAAERYLGWLVENGDTVVGEPRLLAPAFERYANSVRPSRAAPTKHAEDDPDVDVIGYLDLALGLGEAGRLTLRALSRTGLAVRGLETSFGSTSSRTETGYVDLLVETSRARVQVFVINADQIGRVIDHLDDRLRDDAYRIIVPFWELSHVPDAWLSAYDLVDEVWAPTRFIQRGLMERIGKPIIRMPLMLDFDPPAPGRRSRFNLPEGKFLFFFAFDYFSFVERKNPRTVVEAFKRSFRPGETYAPALVLKTLNAEKAPALAQPLRDMLENDPDVILIERTLSREETLGLIGVCDAVVSLHRSEGLGLLVAEAMVLGKPVISTDYSATTELVTPQTGYPVDYRLVPVKDGDYPFAEGQVWAEVDVDHAAWQMRQIVRGGKGVSARVAAARQHIQTSYGHSEVTKHQLDRLRMLGETA